MPKPNRRWQYARTWPLARALGVILAYSGRPKEGLAALKTCIRLDPRAPSLVPYRWLAGAPGELGQTAEAKEVLVSVRKLLSESVGGNSAWVSQQASFRTSFNFLIWKNESNQTHVSGQTLKRKSRGHHMPRFTFPSEM